MKDHSLSLGRFALNRVAVAAAVAVITAFPMSASALGLGKVNVKSALGEPLRAEIDINSLNPEESATLQVRVASPDTYRAAGVDYNAVLSGANVVLQRRADGRPYLRLTSNRPVQEPFVDVILDLGWSAGRLVREYTMLFDPPVARAPITPAAPVLSPATELSPPTATASITKVERPVAPPIAAPKAVTPKLAPHQSPSVVKATDQETVRVRRGDTLSTIAERNLQAGVSLDQMLVGLYRQNPAAFQGNNMNRLLSGAVLTLPSEEQLKSISPAEARQFILAQSADFSTYRQGLGSSVSVESAPQNQRQAMGKVEAEVRDRKQAAVSSPDKLTLSKGSLGSPSAAVAEDRLAATRASQDAGKKVGELSKNLDELRKLKEQAGQVATGQSPGVNLPVAGVPQGLTPSAPVAPAASSAEALELPASAAESATEAASVASQIDTVDAASAPTAIPSSVEAPAPVSAPDAAQQDSGFLSKPMWLAAGVAGLALAGGVFAFLRSRRRADTGETSFLESRLQPDSFFGASGGQRVDTRDATAGPSSMNYSLSQLDAMGDVDPVAEADVYLAYGRDLQAEEILKEALRSTPDRLAVRLKLLEVYAKRRDTKGYEALAVQLFGLTNGVGDEWLTAQELGRGIDPENPLYQPGGQPVEGQASEPTNRESLGASTVPHSEAPDVSAPTPSVADAGIDLDLGLDLDAPAQTEGPAARPSQIPDREQNLELGLPDLDAVVEESSSQSNVSVSQGGVDFDLPIDIPDEAPAPVDATRERVADFGDGGSDSESAMNVPVPEGGSSSEDADLPLVDVPLSADPMARKFDLAQEFSQIGDLEGARELLQEVVDNAQDDSLKSRAQTMLSNLS